MAIQDDYIEIDPLENMPRGLVISAGSHLSHGIEGEREGWLFTTKSKCLDNWDCLGFWEIKKRAFYHFKCVIIVGWLCPHTANTHLYANEDIGIQCLLYN